MARSPVGGLVPMLWAPWGGTRWVLPGDGASAAGHPGAGLGGLIRVLPVRGGGNVAPVLGSEIAADV